MSRLGVRKYLAESVAISASRSRRVPKRSWLARGWPALLPLGLALLALPASPSKLGARPARPRAWNWSSCRRT